MKKKFLIVAGGLLVVLVGVALIAPGFVDWNKHKAVATGLVKDATGRDLVIGGDMKLTILPAPAVVVKDVRLSNLPGAKAPEMVSLKSLEVRIALAPLLAGNLQVEKVRVVNPVIEIETLADGRSNLTFEAKEAPAPAAEPGKPEGDKPAAGGAGGGFDLQLDNLTIENGTVVYRDSRAGTLEKVEEINASLAIASLAGPVDAKGSFKARGIPLTISGTLGKIIHGRTVPIDLTLGAGAGNASLKVSGALVNLESAPGFKGKVDAKGDNLADLLRGVAAMDGLPGFTAQGFGLKGTVAATAAEVSVPDLALNLGDTQAAGSVSASLGETVSTQIALNLGRIDLDAWLGSMAPSAPPATASPAKGQAGSVPAPAPAPVAKAEPFALPAKLAASLRIGVEALAYRGGVIRQARLNADLANGEITLSQVSAQLPGSTDVALFGFITAKKGKPQLEGEAEIAAADLRAVLTWLGVALPNDIPKERLRRLAYKSSFVATSEQVQIAGLTMQMDGTSVAGGATVKLGGRPSFGLDLTVDKVNLDGYLPAGGAAPAKKAAGEGGKTEAAASAAPAQPAAGNPALKTFDANVKLAVKSLTYRQTPISDLSVDGTLHNGNLDLRRLSVGHVAGASVSAKGGLHGLAGTPEMKDLNVDFQAADLIPVLRLAGIEPPPQAKGLGRVSLKARGDGGFAKPVVNASLRAAGAEVDLGNLALSLAGVPAFDGRVAARAGDIVQLARTLGVDYRPSGRLGGIDLGLHAKGDANKMTLSDIKGTVGPTSLSGTANLDLSGAKPKLGLQLSTGELPIDRFLPAQKTAALENDPAIRHAGGKFRPAFLEALEKPIVLAAAPASRASAPVSGGVDPRWSRDALDLSALTSLDADVILRSAAIVFQDYRLENADIAATLAGGVLRTQRFLGTLFGGNVQASATLDGTKGAKLDLALQVANLDVGRAAAAATGKGMAGGTMNLDTRLGAQGGSVAQLVQALSGSGSLALKGLDVKKGAQGSALASVLELVSNLNTLGGSLSGGKTGALADVTGTFAIDRGIATSKDIKLVSGVGNGAAVATVDLPRWTIDSEGKVEVAQGLLTQILIQKTGTQVTSLPFHINGRLDSPNVKLDTASLPGKGVAIPGTDKLLKKKGVGTILEQVLPGVTGGSTQQQPTSTTQQPAATTQQPPPQQKPGKARPEDLLKGILLGR